ncbi:MAG: hypothetical protein QOJ46_24 [bacterium]
MGHSSDDSIERIEDQLDGAVRTLSRLGALSDEDAVRVAQRMDRLASRLLEVSAPPLIAAVHERLGTTPADPDEFASLVEQMGPGDGEG